MGLMGKRRESPAGRATERAVLDRRGQQAAAVAGLKRSGVPLPERLAKAIEELGRLKIARRDALAAASIKGAAVRPCREGLAEARGRALRDGGTAEAAARALTAAEEEARAAQERAEAASAAVISAENELVALVDKHARGWLGAATRTRDEARERERRAQAAAAAARRDALAVQAVVNLLADAAGDGIVPNLNRYDATRIREREDRWGVTVRT